MFFYEVVGGGGRGPVHEQGPVHERLCLWFVYELYGGGGPVHEPAPVHEGVFICLCSGLFHKMNKKH